MSYFDDNEDRIVYGGQPHRRRKMETQVAEKPKTAAPKMTQQQAVAKATAGLPATDTVSESASIMAMLERMSQNPSVNVDTMKAMLEMWERIRDKNAETAFNRDFAAMSLALPRVEKSGSVSYAKEKNNPKAGMEEAFKFALYEDIDFHIRPVLERHGFSLSFTTSERVGGGLTVNGILAHKEGHSRTTSLPLALDTSGGKNNLQAMGSSSSYGRRYAACILLNIITVDEDDNGDADGQAKTETQRTGDAMTIHGEDVNAEYAARGLPFASSQDRKAFMLEMKEKLAAVESEDDIASLLEEHVWKFEHLGPAQKNAMNALFLEAKNQFGGIDPNIMAAG